MQENEKIEYIIRKSLTPFLEQVKKLGLKSSIEKIFPGFYIDDFILKKIRKSLRLIRIINLNKFAGKINIYYKDNAIYLDCIGMIGLFINQIIIPDEKIIKILKDIFNQIENIFFENNNYLINKIDEILKKLTKKEVFSASDFGEKSLYDFLIVILFSYYSTNNLNFPEWFEIALKKLDQVGFAKDILDFLVYIIIKAFNGIIKNIYVNYDILFDSKILRFFLNKNTNRGKVSDILSFFKLDLKKILDRFAEKYATEAFLKGFGEHLTYMIHDLVLGVSDKPCVKFKNNFNFTSCIGKTVNSRNFRWFGNINNRSDEYLEISKSRNFNNNIIIKAKKEEVMLYRPTVFNLGTIAKYQLETRIIYSVNLQDLDLNQEYYIRIRRNSGFFKNKFIINNNKFDNFIVMSDSQGMTKEDYDIFIRIFELIYKNFNNINFVAHLGDFVDDGANENYWDFLLNSKIWGQIPVFPISGNHEAKFHPTLKYLNKNSIINHFNIEFLNQEYLDKGVYYFFEQNNCIYIFLNTNIPDGLGKEQIKWANDILENSSAKWKILFAHKSPYSQGPHSDNIDIEIIRKEIDALCLKFKIDIVFSGHDHVYSRSKTLCLGKITNENIKDNNIFNPSGTVFISLGAVGVKSYTPNKSKSDYIEILLFLDNPSFANVIIENNKLQVEIYKYNSKSESDFDLVDKFAIIKDENKKNYESNIQIDKYIENLPVIPWIQTDFRANQILNKYNKLSTDQKSKINYISKLNNIIKYNLIQKKIFESSISIVYNKEDFLKAIKNPRIGTIIIKSDIIKFENKFGFGRKIKIDRDILIKGIAKLKFITFNIKSNVSLYIGGSLIIDNCRKKFSLYKSITSFILHDNSSLILLDNIWVEQIYGQNFKRKNIVSICGKNNKIFINSENFKNLPDNFIAQKFLNRVFNIFD